MPQLFQARVSEHSLLSKDYHWYTIDLETPNQLDFQAGQFVMLNIPGVAAKKAYSIPSSPASKSQINLLIDVSPQGDGTLYMQSLKPGDPISFLAPAGQFTLSQDPAEQKLALIATGSGISAVRSMALWLLQTQKDQRPINLHWGMRFAEDAFWIEEFRLLEKEYPNFHFDLVLSKPPEGWPMCSGHINDCLTNHYTDFGNTGYYMCGNPKMIESVSELLISKNVNPTLIHHEKFSTPTSVSPTPPVFTPPPVIASPPQQVISPAPTETPTSVPPTPPVFIPPPTMTPSNPPVVSAPIPPTPTIPVTAPSVINPLPTEVYEGKGSGKYKVVVIKEKCIGAASCIAVASIAYKLNDQQIAQVIPTIVSETDETLLLSAQSCPTSAIEVYDTTTGEKVWPK